MPDYRRPTDLQAYQTYAVKVPTNTKTTLPSQVTEDIANFRVLPTSMTLKLALISDEGLKLCFASLNRRPFLPRTLNQAVQELSKEKEGGMVIAPDNYLWTKTADALTQLRTSGDSR